jgi:aryl-alcohol dehydrogenase-like predicted oxidoreductase
MYDTANRDLVNNNVMADIEIQAAGGSEQVIGNLGLDSDFAIDTKVPTGFMPGAAGNIEQLAKSSLAALQTDKVRREENHSIAFSTLRQLSAHTPDQVRTLFLHGADETVPFAEQMAAIHKLYTAGHFEKFGISNFTREQALDLYNAAKSNGYVLPTVYQSSYSIAARHNEVALFPTLRELGISIEAFSPMAAGFLAKTPEYIEKGLGSWDPSTPMGRFNRDLFYKPTFMQVLREFGKIAEDCRESRASLAYRWVRYHSVLDGNKGDSMILGAASNEQLAEALTELAKGPLEPAIVQRINNLWELIKDEAPVDNLKSAQKVFSA